MFAADVFWLFDDLLIGREHQNTPRMENTKVTFYTRTHTLTPTPPTIWWATLK